MSGRPITALASPVPRRLRPSVAWGVGLAVSLLLAGVVSFSASRFPDGLEKVAATLGFEQAASDQAAARSPLADYQVAGLADPRLSGGLAGVTGTLVVLALGLGVSWALTRRSARSS